MLSFVFPSIQLNDKLANKEPLLAFELKGKVLAFAFAWQLLYFFMSNFFLIFCLAEKMKEPQLLFQVYLITLLVLHSKFPPGMYLRQITPFCGEW